MVRGPAISNGPVHTVPGPVQQAGGVTDGVIGTNGATARQRLGVRCPRSGIDRRILPEDLSIDGMVAGRRMTPLRQPDGILGMLVTMDGLTGFPFRASHFSLPRCSLARFPCRNVLELVEEDSE